MESNGSRKQELLEFTERFCKTIEVPFGGISRFVERSGKTALEQWALYASLLLSDDQDGVMSYLQDPDQRQAVGLLASLFEQSCPDITSYQTAYNLIGRAGKSRPKYLLEDNKLSTYVQRRFTAALSVDHALQSSGMAALVAVRLLGGKSEFVYAPAEKYAEACTGLLGSACYTRYLSNQSDLDLPDKSAAEIISDGGRQAKLLEKAIESKKQTLSLFKHWFVSTVVYQ